MPDICTAPPNFTLTKYQDNSSISLSDYNGKVILLSFMSTLCGHCQTWLQHMHQIHNDYDTNPNVQVIGVLFKSSGQVTPQDVQTMLSAAGVNPTFPLLMDNGSVKQQYINGLTGPSIGYPFSYIISRAYLITNKWHRLSTSNGDVLCFNSADSSDVEYFVRHRIEDLLVDRDPWDTVLALDYSGSMTGSATIGSVTQPKVDFLREAASTLLKVWKDYALCQDRIGITYFSCHATSSGNLLQILPGTNVANMIGEIESKVATGCTAMGAGLALALDLLETSTSKRFVILFTDGMQNRNPLVYLESLPGPDELRIDNIAPSEYPSPLLMLCPCANDGGQSNYAGALPVILQDINVPIHTIGIGTPSSWQSMLQTISSATVPPGQFRMDIDIWPNLKEFFIESLVELYRGNSLQVVTKAQGTLDAGEQTHIETFVLNKSVKKMTVLLSWVGEEAPLVFRLKKDGTVINLDHKVTEEETYRFATIAFPHYQVSYPMFHTYKMVNSNVKKEIAAEMTAISHITGFMWGGIELINPDGNWQVEVERTFSNSQIPVPYHLMVIADDKELAYDLLIPSKVSVGEPIPMVVKVAARQTKIEKFYSVEAIVHRPTVSIDDLLSKYEVKEKEIDPKKVAGDVTPGPLAQKVEMLIRDKKALEALRKVELEKVKLQKAWKIETGRRKGSKGFLNGLYENTRIPGIYRVDIKIKGVGERCGIFERIERRTVLVIPKSDKKG